MSIFGSSFRCQDVEEGPAAKVDAAGDLRQPPDAGATVDDHRDSF